MSENKRKDIVDEGIRRFIKLMLNSKKWYSDSPIFIHNLTKINIHGEFETKKDGIKPFDMYLEFHYIPSTCNYKVVLFAISINYDDIAQVVQIDQEDLATFHGKEYWTLTCAADLYVFFQTYDKLAKLSGEPVIFNLP